LGVALLDPYKIDSPTRSRSKQLNPGATGGVQLMRIGIPAEVYAGETRVAATPETVKKLTAGGRHSVIIESNAGACASIPDASFAAAGASLACAADVYRTADIILKVRRPADSELPSLRPGTILIGLLSPHEGVDALAQTGVTAFAMELLPRITRAQTMDVLSSQANIAGYKAVLIAAYEYGRFMPMLMTAAGTVKAARVLVLGAGVAGLQAIATAKRLGAVIEAFDVRPAVKNEVESLGAKFVEVALSDADKKAQESAGGYAREMSDDYKRRQAALIAERAKAADIVITCARPADRGDGVRDEAGVGHRGHGRDAGGQLHAQPERRGRGSSRGEDRRPVESSGDAGGRLERPLRAQPAQFHVSAARSQDRRAHSQSIGRNPCGDARVHRRRAGQELTCTESLSTQS
jgi:NAD/NADP transhydrogenase alpha subunit